MTVTDFSAMLRDTGGYRTPPGRRALCSRLPGGPALVLYSGFGFAVWRGAAFKPGKWSLERFQLNCFRTMRAVEAAGGIVSATGLEHLRSLDGPVVFIGNHMSALETSVLPAFLIPFCDPTFVIKTSLLDYPVFGKIMRAVDPVAVGRDNPREDLQTVLNDGKARLDAGRSVVIFPQATRSAALDLEQFNSLGVKLAKRAGVPVVPLALRTDLWGNGRRLKDFGRVDPSLPVNFALGPPLSVDGNGKATHEAVVAFIRDRLTTWGVPVHEVAAAESAG